MDPIARPLDLILIVFYLLGMAGLGVWFSRRNKTTEEYFLGGRAFPESRRPVALSGHHNMKHIIALAVLLCSPLTSSAEDIRRQPLKPLKGYFPFSAPGSLEQWPQSGRQSTPSLPGAVCSLANPGPAWGVAARLCQAILEQGRIESRP